MKDFKPILLVEDDAVDAMTIERAFEELKMSHRLVRMTNGEEALYYLKNNCKKKPSVILLDLNMPKMNGIEFLKIIKSDKALMQIPVVVVTTSSQEQDIVQSYNLGAAGYITKNATYKEFADKLKTVEIYWSFSELPCVR